MNLSDAFEFENKKITRNKLLIEIFELSESILDNEIAAKEDIKLFYKDQKLILSTINHIELLQSREYSLPREEQTTFLMTKIGEYKPSQLIIDLGKKSMLAKASMDHKTSIITQIQDLIPKTGVVTNYNIKFTPIEKSCGETDSLL